ncbi:hypothetical protein [Afipia felis]|nr:hypothetical protein [Afipia felis]
MNARISTVDPRYFVKKRLICPGNFMRSDVLGAAQRYPLAGSNDCSGTTDAETAQPITRHSCHLAALGGTLRSTFEELADFTTVRMLHCHRLRRPAMAELVVIGFEDRNGVSLVLPELIFLQRESLQI